MKYKIQLEKTEEGFAAWCPELSGCWSQGKTKKEALENIGNAIEIYLETKEILKPAGESFAQGWTEATNNQAFPIEQLFEAEHEEHKD
ncbi:MAG: type II toxin-antitoxin system HicB family antitoxin [Chloroflexi bacterium]|nr:type II toxin-antitoxin system HicB family antitoxin [Chloroflexota bacterium]